MTTAASATDNKVQVIVSENGQQGLPGVNGTDGDGFNNVRKSMLDNPLISILKKNKLIDTLSGSLTSTRSTAATYEDYYNITNLASINEFRESGNGWLLEGLSTNALSQSESFLSAPWLQSIYNGGAFDYWTVSSNSADIADIYGTNLSEKFVATATPLSLFARQSASVSVGGVSASMFIYVPSGQGISSYQLFADIADTENGSSIVAFDFDKWVRLEVNITSTLSGTQSVDFEIKIDSEASPEEGFTFYAMGAQLEGLEFSSSYIPTATTQVTRTQDVVKVENYKNAPKTTGDWSIFCKINPLIDDGLPIMTIIDFDVTIPRKHTLLIESGGGLLYRFGNGVNTDVRASINANEVNNIAITSSSGVLSIYSNGVLFESATITDYPSLNLLGDIGIGSTSVSSLEPFSGYINNLVMYDFAINNDEIKLLSGV